MKVKLTYFRQSGKYYSEGEYDTNEEDLWMIWNEVESRLISGKLPDLVDGANEFIVLVDVPDHPYRHPHLIIKEIDAYPICEVSGCSDPAQYEGWWRVLDFAGVETGTIQRRNVCEAHKKLLIGGSE